MIFLFISKVKSVEIIFISKVTTLFRESLGKSYKGKSGDFYWKECYIKKVWHTCLKKQMPHLFIYDIILSK